MSHHTGSIQCCICFITCENDEEFFKHINQCWKDVITYKSEESE